MRKCIVTSPLVLLLLAAIAHAQNATGRQAGIVLTVHPLATNAAAKAMHDGGNAIDAAVAAALMLGVVDGHNSRIGGGCFMLIRTRDGAMIALDGREMAPAKATRDMFLRDGKADTRLSQTGALASGIPGSLAVYDHALAKYGKKRSADLLAPAAQVAEKGFAIDANYARKLKNTAETLARFAASRRILLKPDKKPFQEGETLRQGDLAKTYRHLADHGIDWFYKGDFAKTTGRWMARNGGIITADDFANYEMKQRDVLQTRYRNYTIVGFPPPSSGGVHVAQILGMLEHFDLKALEQQDPAKRIHVMAEAMKLAFADRAHWLGDPDFANVPRGLVDPQYNAALAKKIDLNRAAPIESHGNPPGADADFFGKHTTHIAAADAEGNWVALTATVNTAFGSKVIIPGTGVIMNNQMDDFSAQPGVPNALKLIGAEANAIAPRKRPLSSMSPTIVLRDGQPILTVGAAGGPTIITQVVLTISNHLDLGDDLETAMQRPRFHHQWRPDGLVLERTFQDAIMRRLEEMGHKLRPIAPTGATQAIARPTKDGPFVSVPEPRLCGKAARE